MSRGGKRPGAGRNPGAPNLVKIPVSYRMSKWVVDWLREQDQAAGPMLEQALIEKHKLKPPKAK